MIKRFYKNVRYIGVKYQNRDTFGEWRNEINLWVFWGRPYNRFEYDAIYEHTPELWNRLVNKAAKQAVATNRELVVTDSHVYMAPIWIHRKKQADINPIGRYQAFHGANPKGLRRVHFQEPKPGEQLIKIGVLEELVYSPEFPSKRRGSHFSHKFPDKGEGKWGKVKPILASSQDGKQLYILSGEYVFGERGIVG